MLLCADDSFYAGYTTDTLRREREHNKGIGSKYTKARRPVQMIYKEVFGFLKGRAIGVFSSESNGV